MSRSSIAGPPAPDAFEVHEGLGPKAPMFPTADPNFGHDLECVLTNEPVASTNPTQGAAEPAKKATLHYKDGMPD